MEHPIDISAVITNFNSGHYLAACVESLRSQDLGSRRLEILVVDSASFVDQRPFLDQVRNLGAEVLELKENLGHGGGCNRGLERTRGRVVLFVNSDTVACPGSVGALVDCLDAKPHIGIVEPRTFFDDARAFRIPEIVPPSPLQLSLEASSRISGGLALRYSRRRTRRCLEGWHATELIPQENLTGAFLAMRRADLERLGSYDEGYPLYYEDTDLFARWKKAGLGVVMHPGSEVVHYGHRSVSSIWEEAMRKSRVGRARYLRIHHGMLTRALDRAWEVVGAGCRRLHQPRPHESGVIDLGALHAAPTLHLQGPPGRFLLELAFDPFFHLAAGHLGEGEEFCFSSATWNSLLAAPYFLRAFELPTLRSRGAWSLRKLDGSPASEL